VVKEDMQARNKLWKAKKKGKNRFKSQCSDIRVLNPDGSLKEIIPVEPLPYKKPIRIIEEETDILSDERRTPEYENWKERVKKRDRSTCVLCGSREWIQVHHIERWIDNEETRLKEDNGVCLCIICHQKNHRPDNRPFPKETTNQLLHYINIMRGDYG
jgi:hypothetical protein